MIYLKDNFLSSEDFDKLNATMLQKFKMTHGQDKISQLNPYAAIRNRNACTTPTEIALQLGSFVVNIVDKIEHSLRNDFGFTTLKFGSAWYIYLTNERGVDWHIDGTSTASVTGLEEGYTFGLYTHSRWDEDWGGELEITDESFLPTPNRLLGWPRDIRHRVAKINHNDPSYLRMALLTSWVTE